MSQCKLNPDAFHAQFPNHEAHLNDQDHSRPFSHEVPEFSTGGFANPDYSRKRKEKKQSSIDRAMRMTIGI